MSASPRDTLPDQPPDEHNALNDEAQLIQAAVYQPEAFRRLYRHYYPRVFAYVAARVGRKQDAEDITATIFMRVVSALPGFNDRGPGSFAGWLFRIASNEVAQFYRNQHRSSNVPLDELPDLPSHALTPDDVISRKELFKQLHAQIQTLSPRRQEVVTLRFFAGLRNQEIAVVLGLDERTVASHLVRALNDLKHKFALNDDRTNDDSALTQEDIIHE
ncbi:sigma-70 family RNA polymerase sigma factor [Phototrophicus methaneseepsis]|uniref:Sigma-70 family RNA polymerase sigma factor n=1 Tax=Phototrophicus methaneseepsis TaxID=2710758 RepID=A0A7S8IDX7_9CHLR|nr:sigma-70 family RNA polymerase sigma factor [Phototrophicus methaneseepsis]QPC82006.1 sigma-70 family RNA polymerase sigma factor [Phototrophicus methaneseepsis]